MRKLYNKSINLKLLRLNNTIISFPKYKNFFSTKKYEYYTINAKNEYDDLSADNITDVAFDNNSPASFFFDITVNDGDLKKQEENEYNKFIELTKNNEISNLNLVNNDILLNNSKNKNVLTLNNISSHIVMKNKQIYNQLKNTTPLEDINKVPSDELNDYFSVDSFEHKENQIYESTHEQSEFITNNNIGSDNIGSDNIGS
ncbi:RAP protein, putative, partial [Hepatocystis sp. ex Piliocolobus tephrosceles]